jgi:hypothetical protein
MGWQPQNVLLDVCGRAKVCDLGLAVTTSPHRYKTMGGPEGTPGSVLSGPGQWRGVLLVECRHTRGFS